MIGINLSLVRLQEPKVITDKFWLLGHYDGMGVVCNDNSILRKTEVSKPMADWQYMPEVTVTSYSCE